MARNASISQCIQLCVRIKQILPRCGAKLLVLPAHLINSRPREVGWRAATSPTRSGAKASSRNETRWVVVPASLGKNTYCYRETWQNRLNSKPIPFWRGNTVPPVLKISSGKTRSCKPSPTPSSNSASPMPLSSPAFAVSAKPPPPASSPAH